MLSRLKNGRLQPPKTLEDARRRRAHLQLETERIRNQLADPTREERYGPLWHAEWRERASKAKALFEEELRQLDAWVAEEEKSGVTLLQEMLNWIERLADEIDFEPDEEALIARVRKFLEGS